MTKKERRQYAVHNGKNKNCVRKYLKINNGVNFTVERGRGKRA